MNVKKYAKVLHNNLTRRFPGMLAVALAVAFSLAGCAKGEKAREVTYADDSELSEQAVTVDSCYTADTTFVFGAVKLPVVEIARIFPTEHQDVYISMRVFAMADSTQVNVQLNRIVSEDFAVVSGGDVQYNRRHLSAKGVENQIDYYGQVFVDTILPQLKESVEYGFFMNMDLRPAWADGNGTVTYTSFMESCGGAACDVDAYYVSFNIHTGALLGLADFVPDPELQLQVRDRLVREMAADRNLSSEQFLYEVSTYINPDASERLTVADFPIQHVARVGNKLVFSYGQGEIAPAVEGCPVYFIPLP